MVKNLNVLLDMGPPSIVALRARRILELALDDFEARLLSDIETSFDAGNQQTLSSGVASKLQNMRGFASGRADRRTTLPLLVGFTNAGPKPNA